MGEDTEYTAIEVVEDTKPETAITKLDSFSNMQEMLAYSDTLLKSKLLPTSLRTAEAVTSVVLAGKELGMGPMAAISNIVVVQGRPTLGIHAIGALLRKAGCAWQTVEDFVPVLGVDKDTGEEKTVDYRTTIKFFRPYRDTVIEENVSFTWTEASKMGLTDKDNWKKMPKVMTYSRCFSIGARRVAPDALLGMYEVAEWAEVAGQKYTVDAEGQATIQL